MTLVGLLVVSVALAVLLLLGPLLVRRAARRAATAPGGLRALLFFACLGAGFVFVDPRGEFTGHAVCDRQEWINGLSNPTGESFHPNRDGHFHYTDLVRRVIG